MTRFKITPLLIFCPVLIAWSLYTMVLNSEGFAAILIPAFLIIGGAGIIFLIIDRIVVQRINPWILFTPEIVVVMVAFKLINWLLFDGSHPIF